jgi:protein arginine kinase activator
MIEKSEDPESPEKPVEPYEFPPERPLECSECRRPIAVHYTGIVGKTIIHTLMCAECPFLKQHLKGIPAHTTTSHQTGIETGLCCGNCGTTLESIRMGNTVGCSACYEVFEDVIIAELETSYKIPAQTGTNNKKSYTRHIGRSPGEISELNPSLKLMALTDALSETLKLEDYEQAASIRDQIKEITQREASKTPKKERPHDRKHQKNNEEKLENE